MGSVATNGIVGIEFVDLLLCPTHFQAREGPGNTKRGSTTVPLTSCWTGLELAA